MTLRIDLAHRPCATTLRNDTQRRRARESTELHRVNRRQVQGHELPVLAGIGAAPQAIGGAAHQLRAAVVGNGQAMAIDQVVAVFGRQAGVKCFEAAPRSRVRLTTKAPPTGTRCWSATAGTSQAVSGSCGCTASAKPKLDFGEVVTSCQLAPESVERQMPL